MNMAQVKQPRRILLLGPNSAHTEYISKVLTQTQSLKTEPQAADATKPALHHIKTPYFTASVPVWQDEVADPSAWEAQWRGEEGAADVVRAIGAWIICFSKPKTAAEKASLTSLLSAASNVISSHLLSASSTFALDALDIVDVVTVAVAVPLPGSLVRNADPATIAISDSSSSLTDKLNPVEAELEDLCQSATGSNSEGPGWEYVDGTIAAGSGRRNEFGESVGVDRLLEALKGGEWDAGGADGEPYDEAEQIVEDFEFERLDDGDEDVAYGEQEGEVKQKRSDNEAENDEFGDFTAAEGGTKRSPFDDSFTNHPSSFPPPQTGAQLFSEGNSAATTMDDGEGISEEMKTGLLDDVQAVARTEPPQTLPPTQPGTTTFPTDTSTTSFPITSEPLDNDPWLVRGKGPSGPGLGSGADTNITSSGAGINTDKPSKPFLKEEAPDLDGDDDDDVQLLQSMMLKLQAARDLGADMPVTQRRTMAAKAVREVMREM